MLEEAQNFFKDNVFSDSSISCAVLQNAIGKKRGRRVVVFRRKGKEGDEYIINKKNKNILFELLSKYYLVSADEQTSSWHELEKRAENVDCTKKILDDIKRREERFRYNEKSPYYKKRLFNIPISVSVLFVYPIDNNMFFSFRDGETYVRTIDRVRTHYLNMPLNQNLNQMTIKNDLIYFLYDNKLDIHKEMLFNSSKETINQDIIDSKIKGISLKTRPICFDVSYGSSQVLSFATQDNKIITYKFNENNVISEDNSILDDNKSLLTNGKIFNDVKGIPIKNIISLVNGEMFVLHNDGQIDFLNRQDNKIEYEILANGQKERRVNLVSNAYMNLMTDDYHFAFIDDKNNLNVFSYDIKEKKLENIFSKKLSDIDLDESLVRMEISECNIKLFSVKNQELYIRNVRYGRRKSWYNKD